MMSAEIPQPIGDTGLFIKFSNITNRTTWTINIPNTQSSGYTLNQNAYQSALSTETQAIANATAVLSQAQSALTLKQTAARPEDVASALGALTVAQAAYNNDFIYAPGDGLVTIVNLSVGEIAPTNGRVISMILKTNNQ
jgi:multidrug resistance efflux pump